METIYRSALWQQFGAAIDMLDNALLACPTSLWEERLWNDPSDHSPWLPPESAQFWYITYHTLFWLDFYLSGKSEEEFAPPAPFIWTEVEPPISPQRPYTKEELHVYLVETRRKYHALLSTLTDEQACQTFAYPWAEGQAVSFVEVALYIMRHTQEHAAQLSYFLGRRGIPDEVLNWVGRAKGEVGL
ncbi:DinB family protein [Tengunoibacter tsumagoiensis]|uniref:DinB-like domain-containing protein n=1 Tax=Tengunoibacter tsumagoiensis TaxID=2014871 RepID=A0A402A8L5_9CHLR|nr:DinB family protein [Tengunoibacter tsumagoiensis]GCE15514.1 hypothetical protein KTT_53730 [Tengunoibacter tsumagoiensis]